MSAIDNLTDDNVDHYGNMIDYMLDRITIGGDKHIAWEACQRFGYPPTPLLWREYTGQDNPSTGCQGLPHGVSAIKEAIREVTGYRQEGVSRFNDDEQYPKSLIARVWNRAGYLLGYTGGNPENEPLSTCGRKS